MGFLCENFYRECFPQIRPGDVYSYRTAAAAAVLVRATSERNGGIIECAKPEIERRVVVLCSVAQQRIGVDSVECLQCCRCGVAPPLCIRASEAQILRTRVIDERAAAGWRRHAHADAELQTPPPMQTGRRLSRRKGEKRRALRPEALGIGGIEWAGAGRCSSHECE